ncbi:MAG: hypothetical protein FWF45_02810 [Coriobacteriia bacterium]|nr:hypothetical protein [Coriobacteriia bacterium]
MPVVTGVQLRYSKTLWFDPAGTTPEVDDLVVVKTSRGEELGRVRKPPFELEDSAFEKDLKPVLRIANERDLNYQLELGEKEKDAMPVFYELIEKYELAMRPVDIEYLISGDKIVFYFSADERVDFRELVHELSSRFQSRIDVRQVGVRDEARMIGGLSHCGEQLCCARLGGEFMPVSIKMAKDQGLPLNPVKISGLCGRLMCCLRYEVDAYNDFNGRAPRKGSFVEVSDGTKGKVSDLDAVRELVSLRFPREDMPDETITVKLCDMKCEKSGKQCHCTLDSEVLEEQRLQAQQHNSALLVGNARFLDASKLVGNASASGGPQPHGDAQAGSRAGSGTPARKDGQSRQRSAQGSGAGSGSGGKEGDKRRRQRRRRPPAASSASDASAKKDQKPRTSKPGVASGSRPASRPSTPPVDDRVPRRRHR